MQLIAPDVLAEARDLSPVLTGIGAALGGLIWLCGWRWHRIWVVVAVTLTGGLIGLQTGRSSGGQILAMGLLLGLSAGLLALELARLFSFLAAGAVAWMTASALFPTGRELWVAFLIGGLLGALLFRFWTMVLTSFVGVLLAGHCLLCLGEQFIFLDAVNFAERNSMALNGAGLAATVLGVVVQSWLERWYLRRQRRRQDLQEEKIREEERERLKSNAPVSNSPLSIWDKLMRRKKRAA
jgi:hypothetical protein